ncbi:sugar ABC transporter permease [Vibrio sp. SS-MA-C1-2]|uniref:carbohydrate ABC transporter permease n=1 Tax=Vibrio sp. SS-MA-C1-2 TaxID=2908646 RepID=UPI001F3A8C0E|nr:sugar ABC transporter permease [Vibrio sp. SS-MA-C1-2]UJF18495.1 sugar ABC transporter permease [Vibrio sp. SS-MA-C1-2]
MQTNVKPALSQLEKDSRFWGLVMISPLVIGMAIFFFFPFFQNVFYSFTDLGEFEIWHTISLENYQYLVEDEEFWGALINTLFYVVVCVPFIVFISLLLAIGINQKISGLSTFRTLLFLPAVTMPAAVAMVWKWLYNSDFGLLNQLLNGMGIESIAWLSDPDMVRVSSAIVVIWSSIALKMIILLAGLQGIPSQLYEAAAIDCAGPIRRFFAITLPMMIPTLFFVSIIAFIEILQTFDVIYLLFGEGSFVEEQTMTIVYLFYKYAFVYQEKGYASAIAVALFIITMLITMVQLWLGKRLNH